jgi:tetratricopeptide (TPR) repeat protein
MWTKDKESDLKSAENALTEVLALTPDDADAHYVKGLLHRAQDKPEISIVEYQAAINLNPSLAPAYAQIGQSYIRLGQSERTFDFIDQALRLSPRDPNRGTWFLVQGVAHLYLEQYEQAIDSLRRANQTNPEHQWPYLFIAAAHALSDRQTEAEEAVRDLRRLAPNYTIQTYRMFAQGRDQRYRKQVQRCCEGLRIAGMAEE